jgi:hypothetical protein
MGPNFVLDKGFQATTTIAQFRAATLVANDQVKQSDGAAQFAIGICQDNVTAADATKGRIADIRVMGISVAINGVAGALGRMVKVATDTTGRMVVATTGQACVGITLTAGVAQGDQIHVLLTPGVIV